jgi:hypothetical protein
MGLIIFPASHRPGAGRAADLCQRSACAHRAVSVFGQPAGYEDFKNAERTAAAWSPGSGLFLVAYRLAGFLTIAGCSDWGMRLSCYW